MSEQITITETYGSPGYSYKIDGVGTYSVVKGAGFRWQIRLRPDGLEPHVPGQGGAGIVSVGSVSQGCYGSPGVPACGNPTAREEWAAKIRSHAAKMIGQRPREATVVQARTVERDYGITGHEVVVEHARHGRLLVVDGYGGEGGLSGGAVRWRHGSVVQLQPGDTLESLDIEQSWNESTSILDAVLAGYDDSRPHLGWDGRCIESMMSSLGY